MGFPVKSTTSPKALTCTCTPRKGYIAAIIDPDCPVGLAVGNHEVGSKHVLDEEMDNHPPKGGRGRAVAESLLSKTEHWLTEDLGLELPKHPTDDRGNPLQPCLPSDITKVGLDEIGRLYGQFVAMFQYASAQLGLVDVEHTEIDYESKYEEAMAGLRAEGGSVTERKLTAQTTPAVVAKERDRVVKKAKKALLSQLVAGYEQGFKCLSREMSRRGIEREEK